MAYVGLEPVKQSLVTATQYFNGDGTTLQFSLQQGVGSASDVLVQVGSVLQVPGVSYTASGTTLIFSAGNAPASGTKNITVTFIAGSLASVYVTANAYPVGSTTNPSIYSTAAAGTGVYWPSTTSLAVTVAGNTRLTVSDSASGVSTSPTTGALVVNGGVGISGATYHAGAVYVSATTDSTGSASGALVVSGGVGVAKSLSVGGSINVSGGLTVAGSFNTTSTNSLVINTPFLFVANTNVSDSVDQGFVGTYNDGTYQRYTGLYRSQSDKRWRLFQNLLTQPSTLVTTNDGSYQYADLWLGNANIVATTSSTTSTTGALTVNGGIGLKGAIYLNSQNNSIALGNGGTTGIGDIGASGAAFGNVWATNLNGTLQTASQPNITGVGTVTSGTWSGSFGAVSGANLTGLTAGNLTGTIPSSVLGNSTLYVGTTALALNRASASLALTGVTLDAGSLTGTTLASTVVTSSLTTVGTIASGTWSASFGAVSGANLTGLTAGNLTGTIPSGVLGNSTLYVGTTALTLNRASASQSLSGISIDGSAGSTAFFSSPDGDRNAATKLPTTSGHGIRADFTSASSAGMPGGSYAGVITYAPWDGTTASTGDASYQLAFGSTATNGSGYPVLNIRKGIDSTWNSWYNIFHSGRTNLPSADNTWDLGGASYRYATVYGVTFSGVSTTAKYADLAEKYSADAEYAPGTVLMFGGDAEVTLADADTNAVAGIVSTNPAHLMNDQLTGANTVALGLAGRVPCKVTGTVRKGNMMVSAGNGFARAEADPKLGTVIGKALENFDGQEGLIEVVVGRV